MRIGVFSDPHGHMDALRTALDWLEQERVDITVCAGDVALGPQQNECISLLAERQIASVQGNSDRDVLLPSPTAPYADQRSAQLGAICDWCRARLTSASRQWLAALPPQLAPAPGVLIVHGGLERPDEIVTAEARPSLPPGVSIVAAGHLHAPFVIHPKGGIWVNAGSVGLPFDGDPRPALVILEQGPQGWSASIHRIPFDLEATVRAIRRSNVPYAERMIETQRKACRW